MQIFLLFQSSCIVLMSFDADFEHAVVWMNVVSFFFFSLTLKKFSNIFVLFFPQSLFLALKFRSLQYVIAMILCDIQIFVQIQQQWHYNKFHGCCSAAVIGDFNLMFVLYVNFMIKYNFITSALISSVLFNNLTLPLNPFA